MAEEEEVEVTEQDMVGCRFGRGITYYYQAVGDLNFTLEAVLNTGSTSVTLNVGGLALTFNPISWGAVEIFEGTSTSAWYSSVFTNQSVESVGKLLGAEARAMNVSDTLSRIEAKQARLKAVLKDGKQTAAAVNTFMINSNT